MRNSRSASGDRGEKKSKKKCSERGKQIGEMSEESRKL